MAEDDRLRWDTRYSQSDLLPITGIGPPRAFVSFESEFPSQGRALDLACGRGSGAVWLAHRGLEVLGVDVSPVAVEMSRDLAERSGVGDRCRFEVFDLDHGLPDGPPVDVILSNMFRGRELDRAIVDRLAAGGLLAVAVLSEVDSVPGPFRIRRGELRRAFPTLEIVDEGEGDGRAWILARSVDGE